MLSSGVPPRSQRAASEDGTDDPALEEIHLARGERDPRRRGHADVLSLDDLVLGHEAVQQRVRLGRRAHPYRDHAVPTYVR
jgi:hypothetical protein